MKILCRPKGHFLAYFSVLALCLLGFVMSTAAQQSCPPDTVCLTPAEMKFYLARDDKAKALEAQVETIKKAIEGDPAATDPDVKAGYKGIITNLKVELAKATGTLTGVQQSTVDMRATIQVLSANCKARNRIGLINF